MPISKFMLCHKCKSQDINYIKFPFVYHCSTCNATWTVWDEPGEPIIGKIMLDDSYQVPQYSYEIDDLVKAVKLFKKDLKDNLDNVEDFFDYCFRDVVELLKPEVIKYWKKRCMNTE